MGIDASHIAAEFADRLSKRLGTRGEDMFDEAMQTIIEHSSRNVSLVSAASLWLLFVLALTFLFVCC